MMNNKNIFSRLFLPIDFHFKNRSHKTKMLLFARLIISSTLNLANQSHVHWSIKVDSFGRKSRTRMKINFYLSHTKSKIQFYFDNLVRGSFNWFLSVKAQVQTTFSSCLTSQIKISSLLDCKQYCEWSTAFTSVERVFYSESESRRIFHRPQVPICHLCHLYLAVFVARKCRPNFD